MRKDIEVLTVLREGAGGGMDAEMAIYRMLTLCSGCAYPGADSVAVQKQLSEQQQASEQALAAKQTELDALSAGDGAREAQLQARHVV